MIGYFGAMLLLLAGPVVAAAPEASAQTASPQVASAGAPSASSALPSNYKVVLEEGLVKVIRVHYGPHETVPAHDHPAVPTVFVYLNNSGPVRIVHDGPGEPTVVRPPTHLGAFRVNRGQVERHAIENLSDLPSDFLRVELPGFDPGSNAMDARVAAPADLSHDASKTDFAMPGLSILRRICAGPRSCPIEPASPRSVVVALSDLRLQPGSGAKTLLHLGDVMAVPEHEGLTLEPVGNEPAHLLQFDIGTATAH